MEIIVTLLHRVLGLLVEEDTVRLGAALRLSLPEAGSHIPLLAADIHVTVDTVILRTFPLLQQETVRSLKRQHRDDRLAFQYMQTVSLLRARGSCLKGQSLALVQVL